MSEREDVLAEFDKRFTRIDRSDEKRGYMENWFIKDDITAKEIKQFIITVLEKREKEIRKMIAKLIRKRSPTFVPFPCKKHVACANCFEGIMREQVELDAVIAENKSLHTSL